MLGYPRFSVGFGLWAGYPVPWGYGFYDPFYYAYIPPSIPIPYKIVTFVHGRVVSFQYMERPY